MTHQTPYPQGHSGAATERAEEHLRGMTDSTAEAAKSAADTAQDIAGRAAEQAGRYGRRVSDGAKQVRPLVERSLTEQPLATLAGIAALGFVLGALWRR